MGPALFGVSIGQISLLINTIFASFLVTGSVSWLYYADRLMEFPTGLLGVALGTILLPSLSKSHADKTPAEFSRLLDWGLRLTFLLAIPCAVALAVLAVPLIATLFQRGQFGAHDVEMTHQALLAYSVGLLGLILIKVLAPGFYSRQNVSTPVKIGLFTLAITQMMNFVFVYVVHLDHAGLALAISLGACANAAILFVKLRHHEVYHPLEGWAAFIAKIVMAASLMAVSLWFAAGAPAAWLAASEWWRVSRLIGLVVLGAAIYLGGLWIMGLRIKDLIKRA